MIFGKMPLSRIIYIRMPLNRITWGRMPLNRITRGRMTLIRRITKTIMWHVLCTVLLSAKVYELFFWVTSWPNEKAPFRKCQYHSSKKKRFFQKSSLVCTGQASEQHSEWLYSASNVLLSGVNLNDDMLCLMAPYVIAGDKSCFDQSDQL